MRYAAYSGTRGIYGDMETSAKALLKNTPVDKVFFLIEDDAFPTELPDVIECINVSNQTFFKPGGPNMKSQFTYMAMMRAALCHVLPVDKVLSLDADTICVTNISEVWDIDISDAYFAAAVEPHRTHNGLLYTNAGVTLFNLAKLRDGKADEIIDVLNRRQYTWVEQDVANYLCQGRIVEMSGNYNVNDWTVSNSQKLFHYAGRNDWRGRPEVLRYKNMPWSEVLK